MEDDIPLYHFDVSPEEMRELIADPDDFVVRLRLRPDEDHEYRNVNLRLVGPSSDGSEVYPLGVRPVGYIAEGQRWSIRRTALLVR
jgi:hypothetical protein